MGKVNNIWIIMKSISLPVGASEETNNDEMVLETMGTFQVLEPDPKTGVTPYQIVYQDSEATGFPDCYTTITVYEPPTGDYEENEKPPARIVTIIREGDEFVTRSELVVETLRRHVSDYPTPFGVISMAIQGGASMFSYKDSHLYLRYAVEMGGSVCSENIIDLKWCPIEQLAKIKQEEEKKVQAREAMFRRLARLGSSMEDDVGED